MWRKAILIFTGLCGSWFGYTLFQKASGTVSWMPDWMGSTAVGSFIWVVVGAVLFMALSSIAGTAAADRLQKGIDGLSKIPMNEMAAGTTGLASGLILSLLLYPGMSWLGQAGQILQVGVMIVCGYVGLMVGLEKRDDLAAFWKSGRFGREETQEGRGIEEHKILDTSVIIDGRIADICKTGFIEGTIVIPEFVLEELQHIADSSDLLKRNRGRRGLDILNKIQKELDVKVLIYEGDFEEISEVDSKLVKLAKVLQGKVVTNDFNLNKVCELQGVSVLNINDLANAVKPVVLPGEEIMVQIIKDGKEHGQGVAYLDDGTMIVVEGGRDYIGTMMEVLVTSVLQTSAGRMIFAKPKLLEKAQ
ncbi:PIN/TRAM domain-containing protein [Paenibacillus sp. P96]|uniref:PIN/TRAM domain-containing protein n=1 Tax=Paenibacillus zeirhizosphaerae TaxID=2987519 RepID=A0ABT9FML6_9BACL|nr:PIN/TRAM domain-containing protein [Paenibacillus sp. P96]MDP4095977.1 PIN/TRAM domain-containing protein [Paenibacillus sp. P96]